MEHELINIFLSAIGLGILFNATPGAVFAESLRRGVRGGFSSALAVQIGSLIGDFVWAVLGLLGAAALMTLPWIKIPLSAGGAILLAWMAWRAARDAFGPMPDSESGGRLDASGFVAGVGLSLSTPTNIVYWAALGGTISALGVSNPNGVAFAVFLFGFMIACVAWCFFCAGMIAWMRKMTSPTIWSTLNLFCAAGLLFFSIKVTWNMVAK